MFFYTRLHPGLYRQTRPSPPLSTASTLSLSPAQSASSSSSDHSSLALECWRQYCLDPLYSNFDSVVQSLMSSTSAISNTSTTTTATTTTTTTAAAATPSFSDATSSSSSSLSLRRLLLHKPPPAATTTSSSLLHHHHPYHHYYQHYHHHHPYHQPQADSPHLSSQARQASPLSHSPYSSLSPSIHSKVVEQQQHPTGGRHYSTLSVPNTPTPTPTLNYSQQQQQQQGGASAFANIFQYPTTTTTTTTPTTTAANSVTVPPATLRANLTPFKCDASTGVNFDELTIRAHAHASTTQQRKTTMFGTGARCNNKRASDEGGASGSGMRSRSLSDSHLYMSSTRFEVKPSSRSIPANAEATATVIIRDLDSAKKKNSSSSSSSSSGGVVEHSEQQSRLAVPSALIDATCLSTTTASTASTSETTSETTSQRNEMGKLRREVEHLRLRLAYELHLRDKYEEEANRQHFIRIERDQLAIEKSYLEKNLKQLIEQYKNEVEVSLRAQTTTEMSALYAELDEKKATIE